MSRSRTRASARTNVTLMRIAVKRLDPGLPLPRYARASDAGLDLYVAERVVIEPGARALVGTGLAIAIPPGCAGLVLPRSGLALRHGVTVLNAPGLIDAGYRGEVKVLLINHDPSTPATLERGERVAQLSSRPSPPWSLWRWTSCPRPSGGRAGSAAPVPEPAKIPYSGVTGD